MSEVIDSRAESLFSKIGIPGGLPPWPSVEKQRQYTGDHGLPLMKRTVRFLQALEHSGVFDEPDWKALDYGCGWGRIASVLLTKGSASQLDLCDAWPSTLALIQAAGFANRTFPVSEKLQPGEIPASEYDFIYSYSVFTHLSRDAFETNLSLLARGLKPGGTLFLTVRHGDFMPRAKARAADIEQLRREGFWFRPAGRSTTFGRTVVDRGYLERVSPRGLLEYAGKIDGAQHLYLLRPA